jgi:hypothetical protein
LKYLKKKTWARNSGLCLSFQLLRKNNRRIIVQTNRGEKAKPCSKDIYSKKGRGLGMSAGAPA